MPDTKHQQRGFLIAVVVIIATSASSLVAAIDYSTTSPLPLTRPALTITENLSSTPKLEADDSDDDDTDSSSPKIVVEWECPNITGPRLECSCDFPHTLRCTGDQTSLQVNNYTYFMKFLKNNVMKLFFFFFVSTFHSAYVTFYETF